MAIRKISNHQLKRLIESVMRESDVTFEPEWRQGEPNEKYDLYVTIDGEEMPFDFESDDEAGVTYHVSGTQEPSTLTYRSVDGRYKITFEAYSRTKNPDNPDYSEMHFVNLKKIGGDKMNESNKITLSELKTLVKQVMNEEMTPQDRSHLVDVKDRITDDEIEIPGVSPEDAAQWVEENKDEIVRLGRKGYNPFDTVDIILGIEPEDSNDEGLYHAVILTPDGYLYLGRLRRLDNDKVTQFQRLLKDISGNGDFDVSVYRTDETVDTEEKFDQWRNSNDFDPNSIAIGFRREF